MLQNLEGRKESLEPPLTGLRVVALEHFVTAPITTRHLADLGAEVIKVERPDSGDPQRQNDSLANGLSANFAWNNRNKRSIALDLKDTRGCEILDRLLQRADVFIHNFGPGVVDRMGFDYQTVSAKNPRIIYCAISGFGTGGPYDDRRAMDAVVQGESGIISITGTNEVPSKAAVPIADVAGGLSALISILAALAGREKSGKGVEIQISMLDSIVDWCIPQLMATSFTGELPPRSGGRNPNTVPHGVYLCANNEPINIIPLNKWVGFCSEVIQRPELASDERFRTNELRVLNRVELDGLIEGCLSKIPREEVARRLVAIGSTYGDVNNMKEVLHHPQLSERRRWCEVDSPVGPIRSLHHPFNIVGVGRPNNPIPRVGEHTEEIMRELEF